MGGKGGKRKGGGLVVPGFGAVGMRTPSPTTSVSGSVASTELASGMSYDVPVKVLGVGVAESVADVAALSKEVGQLEVSPGLVGVGRLSEAIRNLRLVPEVRAHLLEGVRQLGELLERSEGWAVELTRLRRVAVEREDEV